MKDGRVLIERDTIVRVPVRVGIRGAAATEFECPFRVLGIYKKCLAQLSKSLHAYTDNRCQLRSRSDQTRTTHA